MPRKCNWTPVPEGTDLDALRDLLRKSVVFGSYKVMCLKVKDGLVRLTVPWHAKQQEIDDFIESRLTWTVKTLFRIAEHDKRLAHPPLQCDLRIGGAVPLLGSMVPIVLDPSMDEGCRLECDPDAMTRFCVAPSEEKTLRSTLEKTLHELACEVLLKRCSIVETMMPRPPLSIEVDNAKSRWGCCTKQGVIHLTWRLVCLPVEIIDFVIMHEYAHLVFFDHSPLFNALLKACCPQSKERRKELMLFSMKALFPY